MKGKPYSEYAFHSKLRNVGVKPEDFESIANIAINDGAAVVNPVEVTYERVIDILKNAY